MMTIISWLNGSAHSFEKVIMQAAAMVGKSGGPAERLSSLFIKWDAYMDAICKEFFFLEKKCVCLRNAISYIPVENKGFGNLFLG